MKKNLLKEKEFIVKLLDVYRKKQSELSKQAAEKIRDTIPL